MELSRRQAEVAGLVARGLADKVIASRLGISINTVRAHIQEAANNLPGTTHPRHRLTLWFFSISMDSEAGKP